MTRGKFSLTKIDQFFLELNDKERDAVFKDK
jgi:hypothetical protein